MLSGVLGFKGKRAIILCEVDYGKYEPAIIDIQHLVKLNLLTGDIFIWSPHAQIASPLRIEDGDYYDTALRIDIDKLKEAMELHEALNEERL